MIQVDGNFIFKVAPRFSGSKKVAQAKIIGDISSSFADVLESYEINNYLRIAHFMAQVTHESAGFRTTQEFASGSAYEGRRDLGNTQKGDGKRYKGRGLIQLTGRANYKKYGKKIGLDLVNNPNLAKDPLTSLKIACEYWTSRNINKYADRDDLVKCTRLVNGGKNGLEDRRKYLKKAKKELSHIVSGDLTYKKRPVLKRGSDNDSVGELQKLLRKKGYHISIDNDFGGATEFAVKLFQKANGLGADGIVGKNTWKALRK